MTPSPLQDIEKLESDLWEAADQLRANSKLNSGAYFMPVLGIIFLRHAANRFETATRQIESDQAAGRMPKRKVVAADYFRRRALWLPEEARFDFIMAKASDQDLSRLVTDAMTAIEAGFPPLNGVLPKDYAIFEPNVLEDLMRIFNREQVKQATGDVFGRIYEYFLAKFSMQKAHDNGEFFTPPSIVQMIVNIIEPDHGAVFDPACGSGGMFVQSSHFIERLGGDSGRKVVFYGQEKDAVTIRIAKMNLAVHGLEGKIAEAITYYQDEHSLVGKCDFVMANPPFNVDYVDAEKIKKDRRLPFGLPGVNKDKKVSNGNYLWISYFDSYLSPEGRAGFVMSSQASSAGRDEAKVRQKLVETGDVDVMVAIRPNFFYTRAVPCELWHLDKAKATDPKRRNRVLMIDARNIYRKVTRKIYDFSPEQSANLSAIVWLYREQADRFIALVQSHLKNTILQAAAIHTEVQSFREIYNALTGEISAYLEERGPKFKESRKERDEAAEACFQALEQWAKRIATDWKKPCEPRLPAQKRRLLELDELSIACRDLAKDVDLIYKLSARLVESAEKEGAKEREIWDGRSIGRIVKDLDSKRKGLTDQLKRTIYFERHAHWLLSKFPDGKFVAVAGLCRAVTIDDIKKAGWSLTPGRHVGVAPVEIDEDFDFEQALTDLHTELVDLDREATVLAKTIQVNFKDLGI